MFIVEAEYSVSRRNTPWAGLFFCVFFCSFNFLSFGGGGGEAGGIFYPRREWQFASFRH